MEGNCEAIAQLRCTNSKWVILSKYIFAANLRENLLIFFEF